jgi:aspartate aminotransferase
MFMHRASALPRAPAAPEIPVAPTHVLDRLSLGKIVQIREQLLRAQAAGARVYRLESGDPSFAPPAHVLAAMARAAEQGHTHYPPNAGVPALRAAVRRKLARQNGVTLPNDDAVFVTNGAMHALFVTFAALLDAGDEVIVPDPMWTEVVENIRLAGGVPVAVPLAARDGFAYSAAEIERRVTPRTKAIFVNTPHNPTGAVLDREALGRIVRLAVDRGLWVVSDEAYEDVIYAPHTHHSAAALVQETAPGHLERVVSIFSMSKSHAMPGFRVGYLVTTSPVLQDRLPKVMRCSINGVNSVAQWAAAAALDGPQTHVAEMRAEYEERRDTLLAALDGIDGVRAFAPRGAFFVWAELDPSLYARLGVPDADGLSRMLADRGVGSAPGDAFGTHSADAIRFAFSCDSAMVRDGAAALRAILGGPAAETALGGGPTRAARLASAATG